MAAIHGRAILPLMVRASSLFVLCLLALGACGPRRQASRTPARGAPLPPPPPKVELPRLVAPAALPAVRVVQLLYTANVVSDAEPCG